MTQTNCNRCKGLLEALSDEFGPYIHCMSCGRLTDLLAPTPEILELLVKVDGHRPTGASHNLAGTHQTEGEPTRGGKYHEWYGGTRRKFETLPKEG